MEVRGRGCGCEIEVGREKVKEGRKDVSRFRREVGCMIEGDWVMGAVA